MMCKSMNPAAVRGMPPGFHVRTCRKDELHIWKAIHFDDPDTAKNYHAFMTDFFHDVYADQGDLFYEKCIFVCKDDDDSPVGTCFIWKAYNQINTLHWYKVRKPYEGRGLGRALLSVVMLQLTDEDYPIYLHTQPGSFRAVKLYADFGFALLSDPIIGSRTNDLKASLPILEACMPREAFARLQIIEAPKHFLDAVSSSPINQF
ncbi:GNAT family N-acetyltransferase [Paenibacillus montanisoli]|uniref:GNAT family N-acetyltransferase n=2 Tax=Paenibacillus montanisoli TaxID=2081970 RepID=A0A328U703_9BACL|nr:GNAT family N-acetyltransferase [Paenibacillus montanisoli]